MKHLPLACALLVLLSSPAWACRGTSEYPDLQAALAQSNLSAAEKATLMKRLEEGQALHQRGHDEDSMELRKKSLEILDEIKAKAKIGI